MTRLGATVNPLTTGAPIQRSRARAHSSVVRGCAHERTTPTENRRALK
jgi:hypothetical protein